MKNEMLSKTYWSRVMDDELENLLGQVGAVSIEGPRWCGKTTTARHHMKSEFLLQAIEGNYRNLNLAKSSPEKALEGETPHLIDEWQMLKEKLWNAVIDEVDRRGANGQFILTRSASPETIEVARGGVGKIEIVNMRTMSLYESGDSSGEVSLKRLCDGELAPTDTGEVDLYRLARLMIRGGWPEAVANENFQRDIPKEYVRAILDSDIRNKNDADYKKGEADRLLHSLARCESSTPSMKTLTGDVFGEREDRGIEEIAREKEAIERYLKLFDDLYLFDYSDPYSFSDNMRTRVNCVEKTRYFCDVSIACSLLRATPERLVRDITTFGLLFESLCVHDLRVYAQSFGATVSHFRENIKISDTKKTSGNESRKSAKRDGANNGEDDEIDAVIELKNGRTCAFEIKLGANEIEGASENLIDITEKIRKKGWIPPSVLCVICGMTDKAYRRDDGVFVIPITALKP